MSRNKRVADEDFFKQSKKSKPNPSQKRGGEEKGPHNTKRQKIDASPSQKRGVEEKGHNRPRHNPFDSRNKGTTTLSQNRKPVLTDPSRDVKKFPEASNTLLQLAPTLFIKRFQMEKINTLKDGKRVLIIGMSGSGKSTAAIELIRANKGIPIWRIISPEEPRNHTFEPFVHPLWISDEFKIEFLEAFKKRQNSRCEKWELPGTKPIKYIQDPSGALVLDDCSIDDKLYKDSIFKWIFFNSRHAKVLFIMLVQYFMGVPISLRRNLSHLIVFRQNSPKEIKKIHSEFAAVFKKESDFLNALELCTSNYGCMVIDCLSASTDISERIFWYRAKKQEDQEAFKVGAQWALKQADRMYNKKWKDQEEGTDIVLPPPNPSKVVKTKLTGKEPLNIELTEN